MTDPRSKVMCEYCMDTQVYTANPMDPPHSCPYCTPAENRAISWDSIWMDLAKSIALRSTCKTPNRQVGCVIVSSDNSRVLALGYNGSAKGDDNSCEYGTGQAFNSRCTCIHAEMNALTKLDTTNPCDKKMYLTLSPCDVCWKLIVNAGIKELIFDEKYGTTGENLKYLTHLGILVRKFNGDY